MDEDEKIIEVSRWTFLQAEGFEGISPEAWLEMFMTPLMSLGGYRVCDLLRQQMGFDPIS